MNAEMQPFNARVAPSGNKVCFSQLLFQKFERHRRVGDAFFFLPVFKYINLDVLI